MIGGHEIVILVILGLLFVGLKNASKISTGLGKSVLNFKRAAKGIDEIDITPVSVEEEDDQKGNSAKGTFGSE